MKDWISNNQLDLDKLCLAIAIGGARGKERLAIAKSVKQISKPVLISKSAHVSPGTKLGQGSHVLANSVIAADTKIGAFCIINNSANVDHECVLGSGVHIAPGAILCGCVTVGENTMIGAGAVVLPRVSIGKNVIIGAGAVVLESIPDETVVVGNPGRSLER